jgi:hypothetical protein
VFTDRPTTDRNRSPRSIGRPTRTLVGASPAQDALVLLGSHHPLARAEVRMEVLWRQVTAVGVLLAALGVATIAGATVLPAVIAASVVEMTLLARLVIVAGDRRGSARDLIAAGRTDLPVAAVQRERARLLDARHVAELARSLDDVRREAAAPYRDRPREHPLHTPSTIRRVDRELMSVIALLREPCPDLAFVARIEGLLSGQFSPLYGDDATRLRGELLRIAFLGRQLRPGSGSSASMNGALPRTLLAFFVAAIVASSCAPAASASTAHDPGSACHTFQRFHETWRLCPDANGSLQRQRIGVLP